MNKIKILFFLVFVLMLAGCAPKEPTHPSVLGVAGSVIWFTESDNTIYLENMAYIPINIKDSNPDEEMVLILNAVNHWEENNPDREIVDVDIIWQQETYSTSDYLFGITIYSRLISE